MPDVKAKIKQFMQKKGMPHPPSRMLVGLSGGADSVFLLRMMLSLGFEVEAAHCNYGLRVEASEDVAFCQKLCQELGVPFHLKVVDSGEWETRKRDGIQAAARQIRYNFFAKLAQENQLPIIATAHHADDQTETLLASLLKGDTAKVLKGIPVVRTSIIRPLLGLRKAEILDWLHENGQTWCEDSTNSEEKYTRNILRNSILPALKRVNPDFEDRLNQKAERFEAQYAFLDHVFEGILPQVMHLDGKIVVLKEEAFGQIQLVRHPSASFFKVFLEWYLQKQNFQAKETEAILALSNADSGAHVLTRDYKVYRDRQNWVFVQIDSDAELENMSAIISKEVAEFDTLYIGSWKLNFARKAIPQQFDLLPNTYKYWLDPEKLSFPLNIRPWKQGDRIQPRGMHGSKLVSDVLIDQKWPQYDKENVLVIESEGELCLVIGFREARWASVSGESESCIEITITRSV